MMITSEKVTQKSRTHPGLSAHHLLVGVVPAIGPLDHPALSALKYCRLSWLGDLDYQPTFLQSLADDVQVIAAISRHRKYQHSAAYRPTFLPLLHVLCERTLAGWELRRTYGQG
jgi:hypothetical protein